MINYNDNTRTFELYYCGCILICYSMLDLQIQAKAIYNIDILTLLN
jgi:hypothetical protein